MAGVAALVVALLATALPGCSGGDEGAAGKKGAGGEGGPAPEPVAVAVLPARADSVQRTVEVIGTLFGQEDTYISNKIPGRVTNIFVDVGDRVAPGQALAQLLKNDYQLSLNERQALLDETLAGLGVADVPGEDFDIETVPAVRRARLQARNANSKFERARKLHEAKPPLISDQDFADLQTESQVAQSAYQAALLEARTLVRTARTRQAQVAIAEQVMRDTTIRAPRPWMPDGSGPLEPTPEPSDPGTDAATQPVADASDAVAVPAPAADAAGQRAGAPEGDGQNAGTDADAPQAPGAAPAVDTNADRPYVVAARYSSDAMGRAYVDLYSKLAVTRTGSEGRAVSPLSPRECRPQVRAGVRASAARASCPRVVCMSEPGRAGPDGPQVRHCSRALCGSTELRSVRGDTPRL